MKKAFVISSLLVVLFFVILAGNVVLASVRRGQA